MQPQYAIAIPRSLDPTLQCLTNPQSVKAAVVYHLAAIHNCSSVEEFVSKHKGHGKVQVVGSDIILFFETLDDLGIMTDSSTCPASVDAQLREWAVQNFANSQTDSERITARCKIIGTRIGDFCTLPNTHPLYHSLMASA